MEVWWQLWGAVTNPPASAENPEDCGGGTHSQIAPACQFHPPLIRVWGQKHIERRRRFIVYESH